MPFTVEVKDAVRVAIDELATRHGMTRDQVVTAAVSAFKFFDDKNIRGNRILFSAPLWGEIANDVDWEDLIEHAKNS